MQRRMPFAMYRIISVDSSRATAPLILPLMLADLSAGPFVVSFRGGGPSTKRFESACSASSPHQSCICWCSAASR